MTKQDFLFKCKRLLKSEYGATVKEPEYYYESETPYEAEFTARYKVADKETIKIILTVEKKKNEY